MRVQARTHRAHCSDRLQSEQKRQTVQEVTLSEFTDGILFLLEKREAAAQAAVELTQPYFVRDLNERSTSYK